MQSFTGQTFSPDEALMLLMPNCSQTIPGLMLDVYLRVSVSDTGVFLSFFVILLIRQKRKRYQIPQRSDSARFSHCNSFLMSASPFSFSELQVDGGELA